MATPHTDPEAVPAERARIGCGAARGFGPTAWIIASSFLSLACCGCPCGGEVDDVVGKNGGSPMVRIENRTDGTAFYIDRYEVTVGAYRKCVEGRECTRPKCADSGKETLCNWLASDEEQPINDVSWLQAVSFCHYRGRSRLPTEPEWEAAARGPLRAPSYPWGDEPPTCARAVMFAEMPGCGEVRTSKVGSKPEGCNAYGLCDMTGNVYEWTASRFEGTSSYVFKGGGLDSESAELEISSRKFAPADHHAFDLGFRCAR